MKLKIVPFGLACGIVWGFGIMIAGFLLYLSGSISQDFVNMMASLYIGYDGTVKGAILGLLWGFADGFVGGALLAWFYNIFAGGK